MKYLDPFLIGNVIFINYQFHFLYINITGALAATTGYTTENDT